MSKIKDVLSSKYEKALAQVWKDEKMIMHCLKQADYIVELESGKLFIIEKPKMKKNFWFGYHRDTAEVAGAIKHSKIEDYFRAINLDGIDKRIAALSEHVWAYTARYEATGNILDIYIVNMSSSSEADIVTDGDIERIKIGYKKVKEWFAKRLDGYLRRYGTKHITSSSYCADT